MSRDWLLFLDDAIKCCRLILSFTDGMNLDSFQNDPRTYHATLRQIEMIGEAVKFIPEDIRANYPGVAWQAVIATRNILTHVYFGIDDDIIWGIISTEIEPLMKTLKEIRLHGAS